MVKVFLNKTTLGKKTNAYVIYTFTSSVFT